MLLKTCSSLFFLITVNYVSVRGLSADQKSRFAFVIDDTYSMTSDIAEVKSKTKLIFDTVRKSVESHIENFILVTFNDPDFRPALVTNNETVFKSALDAIVVYSRPDNLECPEMSMHGLGEALAHTLPGSYIYLFSDAGAKDYADAPKIKKMAQKQGTQITFVLTPPTCGTYYENDPAFKVYKELAVATSGQVLRVARGEIEKVLDYVGRSLDKRRSVINSATFPPGYNNNMNFSVDHQLGDVQVSVTGQRPQLNITRPDGNLANATDIFKNDNTLVVGVSGLGSGNAIANVGSETDTSVVISCTTNVSFQHGFSEFKPRSINGTVTRPILGKPSYLAIEISSKAEDVKLDAVELLDMNDNVISIWPLKEVSKNFYVAEQQLPPTSMFKVAVTGHNTKTKESLRRLSATPVEPQTLTNEDKPENRRPTITSVRDPSIAVAYGDSVQLQCKVNAYPKPSLLWIEEKSGTIVSQMIMEEELPYDYIGLLDLESVETNTSYLCSVSNAYGNDTTQVMIAVQKVPPKIDDSVKQVSVVRKESAKITCNVIEGIPQPDIRWSHKRPSTRTFIPLDVSSDVIEIKSTNQHNAGTYKCEASNLFGRAEHQIELVVKYPPTIRDKRNLINAEEGKTIYLTCNADGVPAPKVTWYYKGHQIKKTSRIRTYTHHSLKMVVSFTDSGTYTCNAVNEVGSDTKVVQLVVDGPPQIEASSVPKTTVAVTGDLVVNLPCRATGSPQPTITWTKDEVDIPSGSELYNINQNGTLLIKNVTETSQGRYICTARNLKGIATDYFDVVVRPYPNATEKRNVVNILSGSSATIDCAVPHTANDRLLWYKDTEIIATGELLLKDVEIDNSGVYTCRVSSPSGATSSASTDVNVGFPPEFVEQSWEQIDFVLNAEAYFSCLAAGEPQPTATWHHNGEVLDITDMDYRVYMILSDLGHYKCTVSNTFGTITRDFKIADPGCTFVNGINEDSPVVYWLDGSLLDLRFLSDNHSTVKVPKGEEMTIACKNGFVQFPGIEIEAVCVAGSTLQIKGMEINVSNIKCKKAE